MATTASPRNGTNDTPRHEPMAVRGGNLLSEGVFTHKDILPTMDVEMHDSDMSVPSFAPRSPAPSIEPSDEDDYQQDYNAPSPRPDVVTNVEGAARGTTADLHMMSEDINPHNRGFHGDTPMLDAPAAAPVCPAAILGDAVVDTLDVPWVPREFSIHNDQNWKLHAAVEAVVVVACKSISNDAYQRYTNATTSGAKPEGASPTSLNWVRPPRRIKIEQVSEDEMNGASHVETRLLSSLLHHANKFATAAAARTSGSHSSADELDAAAFDLCGKLSITQLRSVAVRLQLDRLGAAGSVTLFAFGQEERKLAAALVFDASTSDSSVSTDIIEQRLEKLAGGTLPVRDSDEHLKASIDPTLLKEFTKTLELCSAVVRRHPSPPLAAFNQCVHSLECTILRVKGHGFITTVDRIAALNTLRSELHRNRCDDRDWRALLERKHAEEQADIMEEEDMQQELKPTRDAVTQRLQMTRDAAQRSIVLDRRDPDGKLEAAGRKSLQLIWDAPTPPSDVPMDGAQSEMSLFSEVLDDDAVVTMDDVIKPVSVPSFNFASLDVSNCNMIECYPNGMQSEMKLFSEVLNDAVATAGTDIDAARADVLQRMDGSFELVKRRTGSGESMLVRVSHVTCRGLEKLTEISLDWFTANFSMLMPGLTRPGVDSQTVDIATLWLQSQAVRYSKCRPDLTTDMSDKNSSLYALFTNDYGYLDSGYRINCLLQRAEEAEDKMHCSRREAAPSYTGVLAQLHGSERVLLEAQSDVDALASIVAVACGDDIAAVVRLLPVSLTPLTLGDELIAHLRKLDGWESMFSSRLRTDVLFEIVQADSDMQLKIFFDWPSVVQASRKDGWVDADAEALRRCLSDFKMTSSRLLSKADVVVALKSTLELIQPQGEGFVHVSKASLQLEHDCFRRELGPDGGTISRSSTDALRRVQLRPGAACHWSTAVTESVVELLSDMDSIYHSPECLSNFYTASAHKVVGLQLILRHSHLATRIPGIQCTQPGLEYFAVGVEVPSCPPKFYRRNPNEPPGVLVVKGGCGAGKTQSMVAIVIDVVGEISDGLSEATHGNAPEQRHVIEGAVFIVAAHVKKLAKGNACDLEKHATSEFNKRLNVLDSTAAAVSKQWTPRLLNYEDVKVNEEENMSDSQMAATFQLDRGGISFIFCTAHSLLAVKKRVLQISAPARVFIFQDEIAAGLTRLHDPANGARYQRDLLEYWRNVPCVDSSLKAHVVLDVIMCATFAYDPERGGMRPDLSASICGTPGEGIKDPPVFSGLTIPTLLLNLMDEKFNTVNVAYIVGMTTGRLTEQGEYPTVSIITGSDSVLHTNAFMVLLSVEDTNLNSANAKPPSSFVAFQPPTAKRVNTDYRIVELTKAKLVSEGRARFVDSVGVLPIISETNTGLSLPESTNYATTNQVISNGHIQEFVDGHHSVGMITTNVSAYGLSVKVGDKESSATITELPSQQSNDSAAQLLSRARGRATSGILAPCPAVAINTAPHPPFQDGAALAESHKQERTRRVAVVDLGIAMSDSTNAVLWRVQQCRLPNPHDTLTAMYEILDIAAKTSQPAHSVEGVVNRLRQQTALVPQWEEDPEWFYLLQYTGGVEPSLALRSFYKHIIHTMKGIKLALKTEKAFANSIMAKPEQFSKYTAESEQPSSYCRIGGNEKTIKEISDVFVQRACRHRSESTTINFRVCVNEWISRLQETKQFDEVQAFVQKGKSMRGNMQDEVAYDTTIAGAMFMELVAFHVDPLPTKKKFPVTCALFSMRVLELTLATLASEFDVSSKYTHEQLMVQWDDLIIGLAGATTLLSYANASGKTAFRSQKELFETISTYQSSGNSDLDIGLDINTSDNNGQPISYMHAAGKLMQYRTKADVIKATMRLLNAYIVSHNGRLCICPSDMRPVSFACGVPMDVECAVDLVSSNYSRKRKREEIEGGAALAFLLPSATPLIIPDDVPFVYDCSFISTSSDAANNLLKSTLASDQETKRDDMGLLFPMGVSHRFLKVDGTAHELRESIDVHIKDLLQRVTDALAHVVPDTLDARTLRGRLPVGMPLHCRVISRPHVTPVAAVIISDAPTIPLHLDTVKDAADLETAVKRVADDQLGNSFDRRLALFLMQKYVPFSTSSNAHSPSEQTNKKTLGCALLRLGIPRSSSHRSIVTYAMLHEYD